MDEKEGGKTVKKNINSSYFWIVGFQTTDVCFSIVFHVFYKNTMSIYYFVN